MIKDLDNNQLYAGAVDVISQQSATLSLIIDCSAGLKLSASESEDVTVEARAAGDSAWHDIQSAALPLDAYAGQSQEFTFRISAGAVTAYQAETVKLIVSR